MRRKSASPEVATPAEVWENMKRLPLGIFQLMIFPATWLCFALIILLGALYVMVPALLLSYLPSRLFGATKGTVGLDLCLGILLSIIGGLVIWGKVNRVREKKRLAEQVGALRKRTVELQANYPDSFGSFGAASLGPVDYILHDSTPRPAVDVH